jgi:DNA-binding NarL/FixJ family response regulator
MEWRLTPREREVLARVLKGQANKEIAFALRCSTRTVEFHVRNILRKAGASTRAALAFRLLNEGAGARIAELMREAGQGRMHPEN